MASTSGQARAAENWLAGAAAGRAAGGRRAKAARIKARAAAIPAGSHGQSLIPPMPCGSFSLFDHFDEQTHDTDEAEGEDQGPHEGNGQPIDNGMGQAQPEEGGDP